MSPIRRKIAIFATTFLIVSPASAITHTIAVHAGDVDRAGQVVTFQLPSDSRPPYVLRDASGRSIPIQTGVAGKASFVIGSLVRGESRNYTLHSGVTIAAGGNPVEAVRQDGRYRLSVRGAPVLYYQAEPVTPPRTEISDLFRRGGFIHPVITPAGRIITDSYPPDHVHHHGIWAPWTNTRFQGRTPDFWNMGKGDGTVEVVAVDRAWSGTVHAGLTVRHRFVDLSAPSPVTVLNETWTIKVYDLPDAPAPVRMFDLSITQTSATPDPLILPEYRYGGLGFRGHRDWNGEENAFFLTSEGETDRVKGHATRARWCHISGLVDGMLAGTAILDHPDNFRHPQPMRIHPKEPFFNFAAPQLGDFQIDAENPFKARYRFVVADGKPDQGLLDRYWNAFARPLAVEVKRSD